MGLAAAVITGDYTEPLWLSLFENKPG